MLRWVIENKLARNNRPGYPREERGTISQSDVDDWLADVNAMGIKSIICLLAEDQLQFYDQLPMSLPEYYREASFQVAHIPEPDYQRPPLSKMNLERVWAAYQELPQPVLIHCSAGIDRTGSAVAYILQKLEGDPNKLTGSDRKSKNEQGDH